MVEAALLPIIMVALRCFLHAVLGFILEVRGYRAEWSNYISRTLSLMTGVAYLPGDASRHCQIDYPFCLSPLW